MAKTYLKKLIRHSLTKRILLLAALGLLAFFTFFFPDFHVHKDGETHEDCPQCQVLVLRQSVVVASAFLWVILRGVQGWVKQKSLRLAWFCPQHLPPGRGPPAVYPS